MINSNAVTSPKILDGTITETDIQSGVALTGNASIDSPTLAIDSVNDRVGIGTTTPEASLEIRKDVASALGPILLLANKALSSVGQSVAINFGVDESSAVSPDVPNAQILVTSQNAGNDVTDMIFKVYNGAGSLAERMRIQGSNGDVIAPNAIHSSDIADGTITTTDIADGTIRHSDVFFMKTVRLNDDATGNALGWNPNNNDDIFTIQDNFIEQRSVVVLTVDDAINDAVICMVYDNVLNINGDTFKLKCIDGAPDNGSALLYTIINP